MQLAAILEVEVSKSQKQSVSGAFQNVLHPPYSCPDYYKPLRCGLAGANLGKNLEL
jgi:hypothetical protein